MAYWTELGDFSACFLIKAIEVAPMAFPSFAMATSVSSASNISQKRLTDVWQFTELVVPLWHQ